MIFCRSDCEPLEVQDVSDSELSARLAVIGWCEVTWPDSHLWLVQRGAAQLLQDPVAAQPRARVPQLPGHRSRWAVIGWHDITWQLTMISLVERLRCLVPCFWLPTASFNQHLSFLSSFFVLLQLSQYMDPWALKQQRLCPVNKLTIHSTCSYPPTLTTFLLYTELCKWEQLDFQFIIPRYPL